MLHQQFLKGRGRWHDGRDRGRPGPCAATDLVEPAHDPVTGGPAGLLDLERGVGASGGHLPTVPNTPLPSGYPVHRSRAYAPAVEQGDRVEVRSRFQREWSRGFEVVEVVDGDAIRYRVKRRHDDAVLPTLGGQTGLNTAMALYEQGIIGRPARPR